MGSGGNYHSGKAGAQRSRSSSCQPSTSPDLVYESMRCPLGIAKNREGGVRGRGKVLSGLRVRGEWKEPAITLFIVLLFACTTFVHTGS